MTTISNRVVRAGLFTLDNVIDEIKTILRNIELNILTGLDQTTSRNFKNQLLQIAENLRRLKPAISSETFDECFQIFDRVEEALNQPEHFIENLDLPDNEYFIPKIVNGKVGNNCFDINTGHLEHLLSLGISVRKIARDGLLGQRIHHNTIHKFMKKNSLKSIRERYSQLSDEELEIKIKDINQRFPNSGIREVMSHLRSDDPPIIVQRTRVSKILASVDPAGSACRWAQVIQRRKYKVPTPNSLWHIDTNHALIKILEIVFDLQIDHNLCKHVHQRYPDDVILPTGASIFSWQHNMLVHLRSSMKVDHMPSKKTCLDCCSKNERWNFVIDGAIDGYSRLVVFLNVHTDNYASSALLDFISGIKSYGVPSRIRIDKGAEFTHIKKFMNDVNGEERNSYIEGKSVHNQRIERLWRDVYCKVLDKYYKLFEHMEDNKILDIDNQVHISCLHFVFALRIQDDLEKWRMAHNNHKIRTEENSTPIQLWHTASLKNSNNENTAMQNLFRRHASDYANLIEEYESNHLPEPENIKMVLPRFPLPLTTQQLKILRENVNCLENSSSHGIDIYGKVLNYVHQCVHQ